MGVPSLIFLSNTGIFVQGHSKPGIFSYSSIEIENFFSLGGFFGGLNVVTVIARSSVNVNNKGSNRSANFFHACFLVLFVLLFQTQLKMLPLSALAAILGVD